MNNVNNIMESQDNSSISKISNKDYYRFDNYGNVVADSIEDLLYDKYTTKKNYNKNISKENENIKEKFEEEYERNCNDINEISLSSSIDNGKKNTKSNNKKSKNIFNNQNNNKSNCNDIFNFINDEEKISGTDDKFLETIIQESKSINDEEEEDKFINTLEGNDIYELKQIYYENDNYFLFNNKKKNNQNIIKKDEYKENEISKKINNQSNNNSNYNDENIKKLNENNKEENNNYKKNNSKENKNILQNKYIDEKTESTKINSKKSNTVKTLNNKKIEDLTKEIKNLKKIRNIRKIHLNSKTEINKLRDNNLSSKDEEFKEDIKCSIKLNLNESNKIMNNNILTSNINKILPKKKRLFLTKIYTKKINIYKEPFLNVINNYCFYTKQITNNKDNFNQLFIKSNEENEKKKISNKKEIKNIKKSNKEDIDNDTDSNKTPIFKELEKSKHKKNKNKKNEKQKNSTMKEPEMWTELDLDKYHNAKKIRIKINNPLYPFYQYINHDTKTISLNKINKRSKFLNNNIHVQKDLNQNIIQLNKRKELGPIKIKRRTKTNSTSSVFTTRSDNIGVVSDYNYFNNKEIIKALEKKNNRNSEPFILVKNNKNRYDLNKYNVRSFESGFNKNNYFNDTKNRNFKKSSSVKELKNNYFNDKNKKIKNKKLSQNHCNFSNNSLSNKFANIINIEFPALSSYFH